MERGEKEKNNDEGLEQKRWLLFRLVESLENN